MGYIGSGPTKFNTADGLTVTGNAEFTGNASFSDNDKAIFGAGSDLQIYHDGSDSYVDDTGTGALILRGNANVTIGKYTGETMGFFEADGAVSLYHNNSIKFATTATGVDVTGTVGVSGQATFGNDVVLSNDAYLYSSNGGSGVRAGLFFDGTNQVVKGFTAGSERLRIAADGKVGIGTASPAATLTVAHASGNDGRGIRLVNSSNSQTYETRIGVEGVENTSYAIKDMTADAVRLLIDSSGKVGIGTASPAAALQIDTSTNSPMIVKSTNGSGGYVEYQLGNSAALIGYLGNSSALVASGTAGDFAIRAQNNFVVSTNGNTQRLKIDSSGNAVFSGSISKASGSFKIQHPLETKKDSHHLVHSFVEGPQADNLYRGKVALVDGTATQNIDTVAGMTEGTFAALNREVQCFTTNETGWTAVKGSVSGNVLTITAQENTCTDTISWMVIGERKDEHMYDTDWTDDDGKVIVEPEVTEKAVIGNDPLETA